MTLTAYLEMRGLTVPEFAASINSTVSTVTKWKRCERFPNPEWLRKIARATAGEVMPNDFVFDPLMIERANDQA